MACASPGDNWTLVALEDKAFTALVIGVSVLFAWIIWPFYGAVFWATARQAMSRSVTMPTTSPPLTTGTAAQS